MCDTRAVHASPLTRQFYAITFVFFFFFFFFFRLSVSFFDVIRSSTKFKVFSFLLFVRKLCRVLCAFALSSSLSSSDHYIRALFVGKFERARNALKRGKKIHCLGSGYPSQTKNVFSLPTVLCLTHHHHVIGLHVSLSSREVKTTRPDFYDDLDYDSVIFALFLFFSLYFSLSLSLFLFVCLGKRTDSIFGSFYYV